MGRDGTGPLSTQFRERELMLGDDEAGGMGTPHTGNVNNGSRGRWGHGRPPPFLRQTFSAPRTSVHQGLLSPRALTGNGSSSNSAGGGLSKGGGGFGGNGGGGRVTVRPPPSPSGASARGGGAAHRRSSWNGGVGVGGGLVGEEREGEDGKHSHNLSYSSSLVSSGSSRSSTISSSSSSSSKFSDIRRVFERNANKTAALNAAAHATHSSHHTSSAEANVVSDVAGKEGTAPGVGTVGQGVSQQVVPRGGGGGVSISGVSASGAHR